MSLHSFPPLFPFARPSTSFSSLSAFSLSLSPRIYVAWHGCPPIARPPVQSAAPPPPPPHSLSPFPAIQTADTQLVAIRMGGHTVLQYECVCSACVVTIHNCILPLHQSFSSLSTANVSTGTKTSGTGGETDKWKGHTQFHLLISQCHPLPSLHPHSRIFAFIYERWEARWPQQDCFETGTDREQGEWTGGRNEGGIDKEGRIRIDRAMY